MDKVSIKDSDRGGLFYIKDCQNPIISTSNEFKRNYIAHQGGAFSLYFSTLIEQGSTYEALAAVKGGAIYCDSCSFTFDQTKFQITRAH